MIIRELQILTHLELKLGGGHIVLIRFQTNIIQNRKDSANKKTRMNQGMVYVDDSISSLKRLAYLLLNLEE